MDEANPIIIGLMFVARCVVPVLIMLGISYVLKRLGLIQETPTPPNGKAVQEKDDEATEGDLAHGKV